MVRDDPKGKRFAGLSPAATFPQAGAQSAQDFECWVVANASHFTCSRRAAPGVYDTTTHGSLREAIAAKGTDPRKMVYAVTAAGRHAMLAPSQYAEMLKLRGED